jgi:hypothetical protein
MIRRALKMTWKQFRPGLIQPRHFAVRCLMRKLHCSTPRETAPAAINNEETNARLAAWCSAASPNAPQPSMVGSLRRSFRRAVLMVL